MALVGLQGPPPALLPCVAQDAWIGVEVCAGTALGAGIEGATSLLGLTDELETSLPDGVSQPAHAKTSASTARSSVCDVPWPLTGVPRAEDQDVSGGL